MSASTALAGRGNDGELLELGGLNVAVLSHRARNWRSRHPELYTGGFPSMPPAGDSVVKGSPHQDLTPEQRQRYEAIIERFEQAWHRSGQPRISAFLSSAGELRSQLLLELAQIDREFRRGRDLRQSEHVGYGFDRYRACCGDRPILFHSQFPGGPLPHPAGACEEWFRRSLRRRKHRTTPAGR
jgi:hypothetical protein